MRAVAQFTITHICDVVTSDTAPENPYVGQLWVNTATVPPETMVWDGLGWVVQNNLEELRETVSTHTTRFGEFQSSIDGMNSYVSSLTETVQTLEGEHSGTQETVLEMEAQISELQHSVEGLTVTVQEQFAGGINYVRNSAGLNGITDDWTITGTVSTDSSTDVQSNTTSDSCFCPWGHFHADPGHYGGRSRRIHHFRPSEENRRKLHLVFLRTVQRQ